MNVADWSIVTGRLPERLNLARSSSHNTPQPIGSTWRRFLRFSGLAGLAAYRLRYSKVALKGSNDERRNNDEIQRLLMPMIQTSRLERAKEVLRQRNQAARLVFCSLDEADVIACLRTMDLFGIQFGEIIGDWTEPGDTSGGAKTYVTLRQWPDLSSCVCWLREATGGIK